MNERIAALAREAGFNIEVLGNCPPIESLVKLVAKDCAEIGDTEICSCCWKDDAQAAAEHISTTIRERYGL